MSDTLLEQQINTAIGTAFTFLVRQSLVIAAATSYWQLFWDTLRHGSYSIDAIDSPAGLMGAMEGSSTLQRGERAHCSQ